jgi:prepilin-type processing-associated H-X9-DG protein
MQNYHDTQGTFPIGRTGLNYNYANTAQTNARRTWAYSILPYLEQGTIFQSINFSLAYWYPDNTTVGLTAVGGFHCPSDPNTLASEAGSAPWKRYGGNYVVNWGNMHFTQADTPNGSGGTNWNYPSPWTNGPVSQLGPVTFLGAPFSGNVSRNISYLTDGTSNTLMMAEVLLGADDGSNNTNDDRGDIYNDDQSCAVFMAYTTPNSTIPDYLGACNYPFSVNPPCLSNSPTFNASRSKHPGGVNALKCDGSVAFFKNSVNLATWRALSTAQGGEVIDASSY